MEHSENKRTNVCINDLPSYEIKKFLDRVSVYEFKNQKNVDSKIGNSETTDMAKNATDLPPSCESVEIDKDDRK